MSKLVTNKLWLVPLFACVGVGALGAVFYLTRLAVKNPDVAWTRHSKPEPWEDYRDKQYKFYSPSGEKVHSPAPKY